MRANYPPFLDLPEERRDPATARYRIIPVPFDATSTFRKGADRGPAELLGVSDQLEEYDIETQSEPCRAGIYVEAPVEAGSDPAAMVREVEERTAATIERGEIPVVLGGEHSVSIGAAWAAAAHAEELTVVQLDAHGDRRESYHGSPFNHACVMARIAERAPILQAGIRSMDRSELAGLDRERIFYAHEIHDNEEWIERLCSKLSSQVYLTIDLDVFDPSVLPSTGTPQPGGLGWYQVLKLIRRVAEESRIIGFDIVELCPDGTHASPMLAAKLLYKIIAYMEWKNRL